MHKKLIIAIVVGLILTKATCDSQQTNATLGTEIPAKERNAFKALLDALVVSQPEGTWNDSDREVLSEHRKKQQEAIEKLRQLGTNALPLLMEEVRAVGRVEKTNRSAAFKDTQQLGKAFEILGSSASPLVPLLISELHEKIHFAKVRPMTPATAIIPPKTVRHVMRSPSMKCAKGITANGVVATIGSTTEVFSVMRAH